MSEPCDEWAKVPKDGACDAWSGVPGDGNCNDWVTKDDWILVTSFWQDVEHYWRDLAYWLDRPESWV